MKIVSGILTRLMLEVILSTENSLYIGDFRLVKTPNDFIITDRHGQGIVTARVSSNKTTTRVYYEKSIFDFPVKLEYPVNSRQTDNQLAKLVTEMLGPRILNDLLAEVSLIYSGEILIKKGFSLLEMMMKDPTPDTTKITIGDITYENGPDLVSELGYKTITVLAYGNIIGVIAVEEIGEMYHVKWHGLGSPTYQCQFNKDAVTGSNDSQVLDIIKFYSEISKKDPKVMEVKQNKPSISINISFDPSLTKEEVTNSLLQGLGSCISDVNVDIDLSIHSSFEVRNSIREGMVSVILESIGSRKEPSVTPTKEDKQSELNADWDNIPTKPSKFPSAAGIRTSVSEMLLEEYGFKDPIKYKVFTDKYNFFPIPLPESGTRCFDYSIDRLKQIAEFTECTLDFWVNIHNAYRISVGLEEKKYDAAGSWGIGRTGPEYNLQKWSMTKDQKFSSIVKRRMDKVGTSSWSLSNNLEITELELLSLFEGVRSWDTILNLFNTLSVTLGSAPEHWSEVYKNCEVK